MAMDMQAAVKIAATVTGASAVDDLKKSLDGVTSSVNGMTGKFSGLVTSLKGMAAAFGAFKLGQMVKGVIDAGEELDKMSQKTGVSVETLSTFKVAAKLADISLEDLGKSLIKYQVASSKAATGGKEQAAAFRAAGLSLNDLKNLPVDKQLLKVADSFSTMRDGADKTRIAVDLFGKSGAAMIPLLNMGGEEIEKLGIKMSSDFAARAGQFNDSLKIIETKFKVLTVQALSDFLPALQEIVNAFLKLPASKPDVVGFFDVVGEAARIMAVGVYALWQNMVNIGDSAITEGKRIRAWWNNDAALQEKLEKDFLARQQERLNNLNAFASQLKKNSLIFGQGTIAEIKQRQAADTAPKSRLGGGKADTGGYEKLSDDAKKLKSELDTIEKYRITTEGALAARRLEMESVGKTTLEIKQLADARALDQKNAEMSVGLLPEAKAQLDKVTASLKEQTAAFNAQEYAQKRSWSTGAKGFLTTYVEDVTNGAKQIQTVLSNAFKGAENALVDFVMTGKMNFKQFATSIISDLVRIAMQRAILAPLASALQGFLPSFGAGAGSNATGLNSLPASVNRTFANGGAFSGGVEFFAGGDVFSSPTGFGMAGNKLGIMGEAGPEAIMPLRRGADGKLGVVAQQEGGGDVFNIQINVASDGSKETKGDGGGSGMQLAQVIAGVVRQEIANQKRNGGMLAPA